MIDKLGQDLEVGSTVLFAVDGTLRVGVVYRMADRVSIDSGGLYVRDPKNVLIYRGKEPLEENVRVAIAVNNSLNLGHTQYYDISEWVINTGSAIRRRPAQRIRRYD